MNANGERTTGAGDGGPGAQRPRVHPERRRRVARALGFFSVAAWVTGVMLLALCVRMIADYGFHAEIPTWAEWIGRVHGWCYAAFFLCTLNLGVKARWQPATWFITAISGVVPFLSFVVEHRRRHEVTRAFGLDS